MALKRYKPQSNEEWGAFDREWCAECCKSSECGVLALAARLTAGSASYPQELVYRNGTPVCTAFESGRAA